MTEPLPYRTLDANEAVAEVAYRLSELIDSTGSPSMSAPPTVLVAHFAPHKRRSVA